MEIVRGGTPLLAHETQELLRVRLRAVATVLFVAEGVFFVRSLFLPDAPVQGLHAAVLVGLATGIGILLGRWRFSLLQLRVAELALFAVTSFFLAAYQYHLVLIKAQEGDAAFELAAIKSCVIYFFGVIMLYGTFIPNTWRRAACVIVPMALVPMAVSVLLRFRSDAVHKLSAQVANFEQVSDNVIMLLLGAAAAVYGTHIINKLRQEAFEARQLGQYRLKELLGAGGMGEVFLAEHQLLKRPCAIKLIRPSSKADPTALARFEREVHTTAKLSHWNTIDIFDYGRTEDGTFYYVMEYLPGLSLADLVSHYGPLPASRALHLIIQTCRGLREAHDIGLVHRDIKPANIFAARLGGIYDVAKLLDFGLVKHTSDETNAELSQDGTFTGSPMYMSPEQATAAGEPDARSDIYSVGATMYFLLTGQPPFGGRNPLEIMIAHARDPVLPPSQIQPGIPADVEAVVLRCLAKKPSDRFPDAAALLHALEACEAAGEWTDEDARAWWVENQALTRHSTPAAREVETEASMTTK